MLSLSHVEPTCSKQAVNSWKTRQLFIIVLGLFLVAMRWNISYAQVTQNIIKYKAPTIVNFSERVQYDIQHPSPLKSSYIEQGEDRDNYVFKPQSVPSNAVKNKVVLNPYTPSTNSPPPNVNINGVMDNGSVIPPDINGAVGTTYVVETTNQEFKIFTKSGSINSTLAITTFFSATGGKNYYDPHICYDPNNDRFLICIDGSFTSNDHGGLFLAISQTGDPTGNWYVYSIDVTGNTSDFIDYPQLGFNTNWVVVTGNDFIGSGGNAGKIYVFKRASLYSGTPDYLNIFTDNNSSLISPATTYDYSQITEYMVANWNGNDFLGNGYVKLFTITGNVDAPIYTAGNTIGVNQPWSDIVVNANQNGNTNAIEDGDTRIHSCIYRNGSLWFTHTVFLPSLLPTHAACDWWQINPSNSSVTQFGRIEDQTGVIFYYYPSLDVNTNDDMLIGYNMSSALNYVSAQYSLRLSTDPINTLESGYLFKAGVAGYYKTYGSGRNRWGDYSGTAFDPSDNSFWTLQEWANTSNKWATQISNVQVACPGGTIIYNSGTLPAGASRATDIYAGSSTGIGGSGTVIVSPTAITSLQAGNAVFLEHDFHATVSTGNFSAKIITCSEPNHINGTETAITTVGENVVQSFISSSNIKIYPNPTAGKFMMEVSLNNNVNSQAQIQVFDVFAREVYNDALPVLNGSLSKEIQLKNARDGIYDVKVVVNDEVYTKQLVISK